MAMADPIRRQLLAFPDRQGTVDSDRIGRRPAHLPAVRGQAPGRAEPGQPGHQFQARARRAVRRPHRRLVENRRLAGSNGSRMGYQAGGPGISDVVVLALLMLGYILRTTDQLATVSRAGLPASRRQRSAPARSRTHHAPHLRQPACAVAQVRCLLQDRDERCYGIHARHDDLSAWHPAPPATRPTGNQHVAPDLLVLPCEPRRGVARSFLMHLHACDLRELAPLPRSTYGSMLGACLHRIGRCRRHRSV